VVEAALSPAGRRRRLVVVWALLGVLVTGIAILEYVDHRRARSADREADARLLLPVPVDQLGAVEIADAGRLHRFERDARGTWFYHGVHTGAESAHQHAADPALAERIGRVLAAFARTRVERDFALGRDGPDYGVTSPEILVLLYRPGQVQPLVQYAVGHVAPDTVSRYVMVVGRPVVVTIPNYQIENVMTLVRAAGATPPAGPAPTAERR
jgi:hypothetical protein